MDIRFAGTAIEYIDNKGKKIGVEIRYTKEGYQNLKDEDVDNCPILKCFTAKDDESSLIIIKKNYTTYRFNNYKDSERCRIERTAKRFKFKRCENCNGSLC